MIWVGPILVATAVRLKLPTWTVWPRTDLRFTQFYNTGRCCPTRASLLTGTYPHQAGIGHMMNDTGLPGYTGDLGSNVQTIAEVLSPAKYSTYLSGKWHVTPKDSSGFITA